MCEGKEEEQEVNELSAGADEEDFLAAHIVGEGTQRSNRQGGAGEFKCIQVLRRG